MKKWTKNEKKWKNKKQEKRQKNREKSRKKGKEGPKGGKVHPRCAQKLIFHIRTVKWNRNEIEAPKKNRFWAPNKDKENERKWKKENERTWKNEKQMKMKKRKKFEKKIKMKKMKSMKEMRKMRKIGFTGKILDDFQGLPLMLYLFFVEILDDFHDFGSECVSFQRKINNPVLRGHRFSEDKWQVSLDVKQKHTFYRRKSTKSKFARVGQSL